MNYPAACREISTGLLLLLLSALVTTGCGRAPVIKQRQHLMGTTVDVTVRHEDAGAAREAVKRAFSEAERLAGLLTIYDEDSEVSGINRNAGRRAIPVSEETFFVIERSVEYSRMSGGAFDITVLPLLELWGFKNGAGNIPSEDEIEAALSVTGYENIVLDRDSLSVKLQKEGMKIDPGAIAKGFIVDRMAAVLKESGAGGALVNAGGDIYAFGAASDEAGGWSIGIRHPGEREQFTDVILLENSGIATSGDYEQYFIIDGEKYSHIFDPRAGRPVKGVVSVTVIAGSAMEADALSTMLFVLGEEEGKKVADELGAEAVFYRRSGNTSKTLKGYIDTYDADEPGI